MSILIGADFVPTKSNIELFDNVDLIKLFGQELTEELNNVNYRIFNLEVPLVDVETPILKCGPNLIAPTKAVKGYKAANVDLLTLANNHIMDQGKNGLDSTIKVLKESGISFVGVGKNEAEAAKPFIFEHNGKRIGVFACAEHEFSIAGKNTPGAYGFDPIESFDLIQDAKNNCDHLIVLYHGGKEHYRYPSPYLQKVCRKIVAKGADLVICQHSHCIGCEEKYLDGTIVYGQGNFLFDYSESEFWQTSLLVKVEDDFQVSYIPLRKVGNGVRLATGKDAEVIIEGFCQRSREIAETGFIENKYREFADKNIERYLSSFSGKKRILYRVINKLSGYRYEKWILKKKYNTKNLTVIENFVECEAHRELFLKGIINTIYGKY